MLSLLERQHQIEAVSSCGFHCDSDALSCSDQPLDQLEMSRWRVLEPMMPVLVIAALEADIKVILADVAAGIAEVVLHEVEGA